jgi:hypothetical protein
MKIDIKKIFCVMLLTFSLITTSTVAVKITKTSNINEKENIIMPDLRNPKVSILSEENDLDPLVDLKVTVTIKEIRAFDEIDRFSDPDFYVKLFINEEEFTSGTWHNQKIVYDEWSKTVDVPDDVEHVNITIQLWDWNLGKDKLCDIAKNDNSDPLKRDITVYYSLKSGHWTGDDEITRPYFWSVDYSGYGRANGCDDNSIYENDLDCELWFDISQNDYDGDGVPYWTEVNFFNKPCQCNPLVDDRGRDDDKDGIPLEWEYKWGYYPKYNYSSRSREHYWAYNPFIKDDHDNLDPDGDSLNNVEEYLTSDWNSDPFRKDVFVELDKMDGGPNGEQKSDLPEVSRDLIIKAFNRQNIIFHLDDGEMGGGEVIPFDNEGEKTNWSEIRDIYENYFLHGDPNNWRKGVFHYGLVLYSTVSASGFAFYNNAFQISTTGMELKALKIGTNDRDVVYASAYMHELGHTLGLTWLGGHYGEGKYPWQIGWWLWRPYKSVMNYGYMYGYIHKLVDFSDGSRGRNDFDDWNNIDFPYFER